MNISFLNKVVVKADVKASINRSTDKKPAEGADIRLYYTGAAYPSEDFVKRFNLEFQNKKIHEFTDAEGNTQKELQYGDNPGCGLDVFEAANFGAVTTEQNFIMIAAVPRTEGRIDMFKSCEYNEDGTPKSSVLVQGSPTFGKDSLIPMLEKVYGITLSKETQPFVDLKVVGNGEKYDMPWFNNNGSAVYRIPKEMTRGKDAGNQITVRRENLYIWALVPQAWVADIGFEIELSGPTDNTSVSVGADEVEAVDVFDDPLA